MMGSTRSSTKRRTLSRTARSSSESTLSMSKKSLVMPKDSAASAFARRLQRDVLRLWRTPLPSVRRGGHGSARRGGDSELSRLGAECAAVVYGIAVLVLPLVHHLVQQRVECLLPSVASQMAPTDDGLRRISARRRGGHVVPEAGAHAT